MNRVAIIVGSHRDKSQSLKVGQMVEQKLIAHDACASAVLIDLASLELPFWQENYSEKEQKAIDRTRDLLVNADAFVLVVPEWNGMVPSAMKNLFLLYSANEFAHKPALIASVSAGIGGTYPVTEMRSTTYKNSRICYIPEHLIFRDITTIFNDSDEDDKEAERYMSDRTDFCLDYLTLYSDALKAVRDHGPSNPEFGNGM
ncbi:NADPH-dependent oxidoreductase [Alteromonas sediminis]|uniref:NADPH-dependent oxidoreductase n=1 Tax=Alteromonas sediminis TaxID=2259342 RepID=A0A3N5YJS2_9ALTE|nr:NAD(P)H-dependent oxidoreductase [Alteromonas sediminis]RPJ64941.1 NADPH-dependent oxidoreductase [Alteromonas sediminis]